MHQINPMLLIEQNIRQNVYKLQQLRKLQKKNLHCIFANIFQKIGK